VSVPPGRWREVEALFERALAASAEERTDLVEREAAGDPELREAVLRLLAAERTSEGFLDQPAGRFAGRLLEEIAAGRAAEPADASAAGARFGPYRVLEEIGAGGMSRVYRAERADGAFEQQVALKVMRLSGPHLEERERRFRAERRVLAALEHPGIARILDGGTGEGGLQYLAIELVDGQPLDRYAAEQGLDLAARLRLFGRVCAAVHYAHQRLIVHRDLKPGNILVDRSGEPRLLDFGIAKLLADPGEEGGDGAPPTRTGLLMMTPEYAAPEQLRGEPVTTATDVYALGVVLYELVSGRRPFDLSGRSPSEIDVIVSQRAPPSLASLPLAVDARAGGVAARDLDAVVQKALAKEPERRYPSVAELADDVGRALSGHPVQARPPSWSYRLGRFVGRHRLATALGAAGVLLVVGLTAGFTWRLAAERDATRRQASAAERARAEAEQVLAFLTELFQTADPLSALSPGRTGTALSAQALLDRSVERLAGAEAADPLIKARILTVVGGIYRRLGVAERAEPLLREGLALREGASGDHRLELAESWLALARLHELRAEYEPAAELASRAVAELRVAGEPRRLAPALEALGTIRLHRSDWTAAVAALEESIALWDRLGTPERQVEALVNLAQAESALERPDAARANLERSLALVESHRGAEHASVALPLVALASLHSDTGRPDQAIPLLARARRLLEDAFGPEDFRVAVVANNLGIAHTRSGDHEAALGYLREALAGYRRWQEGHPDVGEILNNLGTVEWSLGRPEQAEGHYRAALDVLRRSYPDEHPAVSRVVFNLGEALFDQGQHAAAQVELEHSLTLFES
jgi:serine/threonine-protein kinase